MIIPRNASKANDLFGLLLIFKPLTPSIKKKLCRLHYLAMATKISQAKKD